MGLILIQSWKISCPLFITTFAVLRIKKDILETELSNFDVICLTETWLDQRTENVDIELNGYITYRRDRVGDSHGGVCVYVSKNFVSKRKDTLELPDIDCVWVELLLRNKKLLIGTFYRPPNSSPAVLFN